MERNDGVSLIFYTFAVYLTINTNYSLNTTMKRIVHILLLLGAVLTTWAQGTSALEQLKADPRKAYGTDYSTSATMAATARATTGTTCSTASWTHY